MGARRSHLVSLGAAAAVACNVLAGIENRPFRVDVKDAGAEAAAPTDECAHAGFPAATGADDDAVTERSFTLAMRSVELLEVDDAGPPPGYDLDGTCTCFPGRTARGGAASCVSKQIACDKEDAGVDNALTNVLAAGPSVFKAGGDPLHVNAWAKCGQATLILSLGRYNGRRNDGSVTISIVPSYGLLLHDGGLPEGGLGSQCPDERALWDGTDIWSGDPDFYKYQGAADQFMPQRVAPGHVVDGQLVAGFGAVAVPLQVGIIPLELASAHLVGKLTPLDEQGREYAGGFDGKATSFRIDGVVAGRLAARDLVRILGESDPLGLKGPLCADPIFGYIRDAICRGADLVVDPGNDFANDSGLACDALSFAGRMSLLPAHLGQPHAFDGGPPQCPDFDAACP